ncbi:MAG: hypothetical protein AAGA75_03960 [Cyanobacteria bacterium P01_E01_bin.6]
MSTTIDIRTYRLIKVMADTSKTLSKFGCCDAIARNSLMIDTLKLL